ncbi:hypothetical protein P7C70_g2452, partial [Phenoliferia sp. Uapishka_3]
MWGRSPVDSNPRVFLSAALTFLAPKQLPFCNKESTIIMLVLPASHSRRESRDLLSSPSFSLAARLSHITLSRRPSNARSYKEPTPPASQPESDSGYSSENDGCSDEALCRRRRRRSTLDDRTWLREWLSGISEKSEIKDSGGIPQGRNVKKLAREAKALVEALEDGCIVGSFLLSKRKVYSELNDYVKVGSNTITRLDRTTVPDPAPEPTVNPWRSSTALAKQIIMNPFDFGTKNPNHRTLELGAGSGLVSLVWNALSDSSTSSSQIVVTDCHEQTLEDISCTISEFSSNRLNPDCHITATKLDWSSIHASRAFTEAFHCPPPVLPSPLNLPFDTIIASDIVYSPNHAPHIYSCIEQFLAKPPNSDEGRERTPYQDSAFWLAIPRGREYELVERSVESTFRRKTEGREWAIGIQNWRDEVRGRESCRVYRIGWC